MAGKEPLEPRSEGWLRIGPEKPFARFAARQQDRREDGSDEEARRQAGCRARGRPAGGRVTRWLK